MWSEHSCPLPLIFSVGVGTSGKGTASEAAEKRSIASWFERVRLSAAP